MRVSSRLTATSSLRAVSDGGWMELFVRVMTRLAGSTQYGGGLVNPNRDRRYQSMPFPCYVSLQLLFLWMSRQGARNVEYASIEDSNSTNPVKMRSRSVYTTTRKFSTRNVCARTRRQASVGWAQDQAHPRLRSLTEELY